MNKPKFLAILSVVLVVLLAGLLLVFSDPRSRLDGGQVVVEQQPEAIPSSNSVSAGAFKPDTPAAEPDRVQTSSLVEGLAKAREEMQAQVLHVRALVSSVRRRTLITAVLVVVVVAGMVTGIVLINNRVAESRAHEAALQAARGAQEQSATQNFGKAVYDYFVPPQKGWLQTTVGAVVDVYFVAHLLAGLAVLALLLLTVIAYRAAICKGLKSVGEMFEPVTDFCKWTCGLLKDACVKLWEWLKRHVFSRPFSGIIPL